MIRDLSDSQEQTVLGRLQMTPLKTINFGATIQNNPEFVRMGSKSNALNLRALNQKAISVEPISNSVEVNHEPIGVFDRKGLGAAERSIGLKVEHHALFHDIKGDLTEGREIAVFSDRLRVFHLLIARARGLSGNGLGSRCSGQGGKCCPPDHLVGSPLVEASNCLGNRPGILGLFFKNFFDRLSLNGSARLSQLRMG